MADGTSRGYVAPTSVDRDTIDASGQESMPGPKPSTVRLPSAPPSREHPIATDADASADTSEAPPLSPLETVLMSPGQRTSPAELTKWKDMIEEVGLLQYMRLHPDRFYRRVRRGIPPQFRWQVWKEVVHMHGHQHPIRQDYRLLSTQHNPFTEMIEIDISRTFPELQCFGQDQQQQLWRVLNAYASHNPELGYCQGMNFVAGLLLLVSNFQEEECFTVLAFLMDHVDLAGIYGKSHPLLRRYLRACDMLVKETVPDLYEHFRREEVQAPVYLHQWFLTLFINCFPLSMVTIIWDAIMCEGLEVVLRIAVSILHVLRESLLAMQLEEISKFFRMMKTYDEEDGELNASRIGQLLMKHTELVNVPQYILDELSNDAADDETLANHEEADGTSSSTWMTGLNRVLSGFALFSYSGSNRNLRRASARASDTTPTGADPAHHRNVVDGNSSGGVDYPNHF